MENILEIHDKLPQHIHIQYYVLELSILFLNKNDLHVLQHNHLVLMYLYYNLIHF